MIQAKLLALSSLASSQRYPYPPVGGYPGGGIGYPGGGIGYPGGGIGYPPVGGYPPYPIGGGYPRKYKKWFDLLFDLNKFIIFR